MSLEDLHPETCFEPRPPWSMNVHDHGPMARLSLSRRGGEKWLLEETAKAFQRFKQRSCAKILELRERMDRDGQPNPSRMGF